MTVLVIDSGVGGLGVLREARMLMPDHQFVLLADDAAFPYGVWHEDGLVEHLVALFGRALERYHPDLVIIACNTASTLVLEALREKFSVPVVGTVPAIKPAAAHTASGLVSVLATPGTVKRDYTRELIDKFAGDVQVTLVGSASLAAIAEAYMAGVQPKEEEIANEIAPCFVETGDKRTDIVVLACTHYPFLINRLRSAAAWPVDWLDPAEAIARHALTLLKAGTERSLQGKDLVAFTSAMPAPGILRLTSGFGLQLDAGAGFN